MFYLALNVYNNDLKNIAPEALFSLLQIHFGCVANVSVVILL